MLHLYYLFGQITKQLANWPYIWVFKSCSFFAGFFFFLLSRPCDVSTESAGGGRNGITFSISIIYTLGIRRLDATSSHLVKITGTLLAATATATGCQKHSRVNKTRKKEKKIAAVCSEVQGQINVWQMCIIYTVLWPEWLRRPQLF
jgi:hypothetical protein